MIISRVLVVFLQLVHVKEISMEDGVNLATKVIVGDFNFAMVKMDREGGNKTHFIDAVPIIPCQNSPLVMGWGSMGKGELHFLWVHLLQ